MTEYRFDNRPASPSSDETVIQRGRLYRLPDDWTTDAWRNYWDGDQMVAVYDDADRYISPTRGNDDTERVEFAMRMWREYGDEDIDDMLTRLAARIAHSWGHPRPWEACFVAVGVDRGVTLYALAWSKDRAGEWRDEIEAVYHGEIYRIEVEEWDGDGWQPADDMYDQWYGEDSAQAGFEMEFPLAEVPEPLLVTSDN